MPRAGVSVKCNYDSIAYVYTKIADAVSLNQTIRSKEFLKSKITPGQTMLEVGCGAGDFSLSCAQVCSKVIGLDGSARMIEIAKRKAQGAKVEGTQSARLKNNRQSIESNFDSSESENSHDNCGVSVITFAGVTRFSVNRL